MPNGDENGLTEKEKRQEDVIDRINIIVYFLKDAFASRGTVDEPSFPDDVRRLRLARDLWNAAKAVWPVYFVGERPAFVKYFEPQRTLVAPSLVPPLSLDRLPEPVAGREAPAWATTPSLVGTRRPTAVLAGSEVDIEDAIDSIDELIGRLSNAMSQYTEISADYALFEDEALDAVLNVIGTRINREIGDPESAELLLTPPAEEDVRASLLEVWDKALEQPPEDFIEYLAEGIATNERQPGETDADVLARKQELASAFIVLRSAELQEMEIQAYIDSMPEGMKERMQEIYDRHYKSFTADHKTLLDKHLAAVGTGTQRMKVEGIKNALYEMLPSMDKENFSTDFSEYEKWRALDYLIEGYTQGGTSLIDDLLKQAEMLGFDSTAAFVEDDRGKEIVAKWVGMWRERETVREEFLMEQETRLEELEARRVLGILTDTETVELLRLRAAKEDALNIEAINHDVFVDAAARMLGLDGLQMRLPGVRAIIDEYITDTDVEHMTPDAFAAFWGQEENVDELRGLVTAQISEAIGTGSDFETAFSTLLSVIPESKRPVAVRQYLASYYEWFAAQRAGTFEGTWGEFVDSRGYEAEALSTMMVLDEAKRRAQRRHTPYGPEVVLPTGQGYEEWLTEFNELLLPTPTMPAPIPFTTAEGEMPVGTPVSGSQYWELMRMNQQSVINQLANSAMATMRAQEAGASETFLQQLESWGFAPTEAAAVSPYWRQAWQEYQAANPLTALLGRTVVMGTGEIQQVDTGWKPMTQWLSEDAQKAVYAGLIPFQRPRELWKLPRD